MELELKELLNNSYSPYSNFRVSAIVKMKDGNMFKGINVENASYGATICAERVAITNAVSNGYRKCDFDSLYVMVDSEKISSCCFMCRQVISEFFEAEDGVTLYNNLGDFKKLKVSELCPLPFNSDDLNI